MKIKYTSIILFISTIIVCFYLINNLVESSGKVDWFNINISFGNLALSILLFIFAFFYSSYIQFIILRGLNENISLIKVFFIFNLSNLGRYVPGKIWAFAGYIYLMKQQGVRAHKSLAAIFLQSICEIIISLLFIIGIGFIYPQRLEFINNNIFLLFFGLLSLIIILTPIFYNKLVTRIYLWRYPEFKKNQIENISYLLLIKTFILTGLYWLIMSIAFYYFTLGFTSESIALNSYFFAILPISWTLGFLVLFAPMGLGIRETALVFFLVPIMSEISAVQISVLSRIMFTIISIILGIISFFFLGKPKLNIQHN